MKWITLNSGDKASNKASNEKISPISQLGKYLPLIDRASMSRPIRRTIEDSANEIVAWRTRLLMWIGIILVFAIGSVLFNRLVAQSNLTARRNHVYCGLVKLGMTEAEVSNALSQVGKHVQAPGETFLSPGMLPQKDVQDVVSYRYIYWSGSEVEPNYDLWLWLGYDKSGHLAWKGRYDSKALETISCP